MLLNLLSTTDNAELVESIIWFLSNLIDSKSPEIKSLIIKYKLSEIILQQCFKFSYYSPVVSRTLIFLSSNDDPESTFYNSLIVTQSIELVGRVLKSEADINTVNLAISVINNGSKVEPNKSYYLCLENGIVNQFLSFKKIESSILKYSLILSTIGNWTSSTDDIGLVRY